MDDTFLLLMLLFGGIGFFAGGQAKKVRQGQIKHETREQNGTLVVLTIVELMCDVGFMILLLKFDGLWVVLIMWAVLTLVDIHIAIRHQITLHKLIKNVPA